MNRKEIYYFIGKCLILDDHPELIATISEYLKSADFPWETFVKMGSDHLVLPALYSRFADTDLIELLPKELSLHLKEIYNLNHKRNTRIKSQILWMNSLFHSSGIRPVFMKGAGTFFDCLYDDPAVRIMADIDCLLSRNTCPLAADLLIKEGFDAPEMSDSDLAMMHHWPTLQKSGSEDIDLHWQPVTQRYTGYLAGWEERAVSMKAESKQAIHLLSSKDKILINFLHSQLQDGGQHFARVSLRDAYEVYRLLRTEDLSEEINATAPDLKGYFNNYMALVARLFPPFQPASTRNTARSRRYIIRLDKNKTNRVYHRVSKIYLTLLWQLYHYFRIGLRAVYRKEYRSYLFSRLKNPGWFRKHAGTVGRRMK